MSMNVQKKLHVAFAAYRDWAMPILETIRRHPRVGHVELCTTDAQLDCYLWMQRHNYGDVPSNDVDLVMYCGWSSEPNKFWIEQVPHVGLHCAESDIYSAGTPLQNQIIAGLKETKHRVFKVGHPELVLREWSHETTIDLRGHVEDVLEQLTVTGKLLYNQFLDDWPNVIWQKWPAVPEKKWCRKRAPVDSRLTHQDIDDMSTEELYNFFRCLEDPYPNGYIEDATGRLYVERVRFEKK